jgi:YVTN family beta-propeller protein
MHRRGSRLGTMLGGLLAAGMLAACSNGTTSSPPSSTSAGRSSPASPSPSLVSPAQSATPAPGPSPSAVPAIVNVYANDAAGNFSPAVAGIPERVYVPNTFSGTVSVINPNTYRVVKTLSVGGEPHHVTPSWNLRTLYVDNPGNSTLDPIDPRTATLRHRFRVPDPYNLYFTPDGTKALVVAEYDRVIEFRDPHTWKVLKRVFIPWPGVDHMDFSADGRYLLASCEYSGEVVRVDTRRMAVTGAIHVGGRPVDVKVSPDGSVFFVANQGRSGVSVIDPVRMRQIAFIRTGVGAHGMAVSRNTKLLYVSNRIAGTISVISFATRRVVATWHVGGSPDMLQVAPDGSQLWTSNRFGDTVSVISTRTGRVIHRIRVGLEPHGLAYFPQPGRYSVGHNGVYR